MKASPHLGSAPPLSPTPRSLTPPSARSGSLKQFYELVAGKATPSPSSLRSHDVDAAAAPAASMFNIIYGAYVSCGISKVRYSETVKDRVRVAGDDAAATRCATSDSNSSSRGSSRGARGGTVCDKNLGVTSQIIFNEMQEGSTGTGAGH